MLRAMAEPLAVHHAPAIFDSAIVLLEAETPVDGGFGALLEKRGFRVLHAANAASVIRFATQRGDVALVIIDQRTSLAGSNALAEQLQPLKQDFPWLEYLAVGDTDAQLPEDAEQIAADTSDDALLAAVSDAYNLARLQQFQLAERKNLERSLREFKARTEAAVSDLIAQAQGRGTTTTSEAAEDSTQNHLLRRIKEERTRARIREQMFGSLALGHSGWALLLALSEAQAGGYEITVKSAAYSAGLPLSSALRKINELCAKDLLTRRQDPADSRRSFIGLTEPMRAALQEYFTAAEAVRPKLGLTASA